VEFLAFAHPCIVPRAINDGEYAEGTARRHVSEEPSSRPPWRSVQETASHPPHCWRRRTGREAGHATECVGSQTPSPTPPGWHGPAPVKSPLRPRWKPPTSLQYCRRAAGRPRGPPGQPEGRKDRPGGQGHVYIRGLRPAGSSIPRNPWNAEPRGAGEAIGRELICTCKMVPNQRGPYLRDGGNRHRRSDRRCPLPIEHRDQDLGDLEPAATPVTLF
jgi:hypothetical protein